jgi:ATPase complex subunit ATP10
MQRGYFDDFRDFRDTGGKVFRAPEGLIPSAAAPSFPKSQMLLPDSSPIDFPFVRDADHGDIPYLTLTCIAFRAGAQDMVDTWKTVFEDAIAQNEGLGKSAFVELALIESVVMASWPFRSMIMAQGLRNGTSRPPLAGNLDAHRLSTRYLYHFGDATTFRSALQMTNRLTAYAYLLDAQGKVRWQGSGKPDKREKEVLTLCCTKLLLSSNS